MKRALGFFALVLLLGAVAARAQQSYFFVSPDQIAFGSIAIGQSATSQVSASSSFEGLTVMASSDNPAFTISPSSQVVGTDGVNFTVRFAPTAPGLQSGIITFYEDVEGDVRAIEEIAVSGTGYSVFTVNPTTLTFDPALVGSMTSKTFRILPGQSEGGIDVSVQSSNPEVFSVSPIEFSNLQMGQPGLVTVTFKPNTAGSLRGSIRVTGGGTTASVEVEGEGVAFLLSTAQLDLGGALVGCSTTRPFTLTTGGMFDFQIVPTTSGLPFTTEPATFSAAVPTEIMALFTPTMAGAAQGVFRIFARSDGKIVQQQDLPIAGVGTEPVPSPESLDFGDTPAGTTSATRSVTITPNPAASFQGAYSASSDNPAFKVVSTNTSGRVDVVFSPLSEGPASGIITVEVASQSNRECSVEVQVPVQGTGTQAQLTLSPTSLDFGMQQVGQAMVSEVLITNASSTPFTGTASSDNPAFRVNPATQGAVAQTAINVPGSGSTRVPIVFEPDALGAASGTITFEFEGTPAGSSQPIALVRTVSVQGEGIAANLSYMVVQAGAPAVVSPGGTVDFGPTGVGSTNSLEFTIHNDGETAAPINLISASDAPIFAAAGPTLPTNIPPGGDLTLTLGFQPAAFSSYSGTLEFGSAVFVLEGRGVLGGAEITGVEDTLTAGEQGEVGVELSAPAPEELSGILTLAYTPGSGLPADPSVQFLSGGTSVPFTVPAGSTDAVFSGGGSMMGFQAGTVAGEFLFSASLENSEIDVTPTPAPTRTASVAAGSPTISRVTLESVTANGFTVIVEGFSPTREVTQATFSFTGRNGVQVQPASVTPTGIGAAFQSWYASEDSATYGSMFTLTMPFTLSGEANGIASVSVTVSNSQGASPAVSGNLP